jgi:hypothetical protein
MANKKYCSVKIPIYDQIITSEDVIINDRFKYRLTHSGSQNTWSTVFNTVSWTWELIETKKFDTIYNIDTKLKNLNKVSFKDIQEIKKVFNTLADKTEYFLLQVA